MRVMSSLQRRNQGGKCGNRHMVKFSPLKRRQFSLHLSLEVKSTIFKGFTFIDLSFFFFFFFWKYCSGKVFPHQPPQCLWLLALPLNSEKETARFMCQSFVRLGYHAWSTAWLHWKFIAFFAREQWALCNELD